MIYYLQTDSDRLLITMYSKSDQGDVPAAELCHIIETYQADPEAEGG